jgi:HAD superfamily hydrolase (TIGR01509 family)
MIEAVIFDKDGVLMLTELIYFRAYQATLTHFGANGTEYDWDVHSRMNGTPTSERFLFLKKMFGLKISFDDFLPEYRKRYTEIIMSEGLVVPEGVQKLLNELKKINMPISIATGGSKKSTGLTLEKTGLASEFEIVVTSDEVAKGKPDPEIFLLAAQRMNIHPHKCLVIGDSINDVLGAKAAGMKVIAITDDFYSRDPALASPDIEVKEFKEITLEMIKSI